MNAISSPPRRDRPGWAVWGNEAGKLGDAA